MKTLQKSLSFLLILCLLCSGLLVCGVNSEDDFDYVLKGGKAIVTGYSGEDVNVRIPDTIAGAPVTGIDVDAFAGNRKIVSVTLPDSVTETVPEQFAFCTALQEIRFGKNFNTIGSSTFWNCSALRSIVIPDSVTVLGVGAFRDCFALETVVIGKGVTELVGDLFDMCTALHTVYCGENVTAIDDSTFSGCLTDGGDLYVFGKTTGFPVKALGRGFTGTIHCFEDTPICAIAENMEWNIVTFEENHIEVTLDAPLSVTVSDTAQPVPTTGVHVWKAYSDSTNASAVLPMTDVTVSSVIPKTMVFDTVGTASVPVSASGFNASYNVTVNAPIVETGIRIDKAPTKTYTASDTAQTIDKTGLCVYLQFSDGHEEDITASCSVPAAMVLNTVGAAQIPVSYKTFTASYNATVNAPVVPTGIRVVAVPADTLYYVSDTAQTIDTAGLRVCLQYSDGHEEDVTADCTVSGTQVFMSEGIRAVAVQYGDFTTSFPITVQKVDLTITGGNLIKKKIALFSSYKKNPVQLMFSGLEPEKIASVQWRVTEGKKLAVDQSGKVTYSKISAGTGVVELVVTDIHGAVLTARTRIIFHRFNLQLPILFSRYL